MALQAVATVRSPAFAAARSSYLAADLRAARILRRTDASSLIRRVGSWSGRCCPVAGPGLAAGHNEALGCCSRAGERSGDVGEQSTDCHSCHTMQDGTGDTLRIMTVRTISVGARFPDYPASIHVSSVPVLPRCVILPIMML